MKQERASCKHLTHKYASYFGCTLNEMLMISAVSFAVGFLLSLVLALFLGNFFLILIGIFIITYGVIRVVARKVGKTKENRQQGYVELKMKQYVAKQMNWRIPYVVRQGHWSTRRRV